MAARLMHELPVMATLARIADELYALTPAEFTPARNALAKETKPNDAPLAAQVMLLRKPAPAAWLLNALVRHRPGEVDEALALGESLREAQAGLDRDELQRLTKQRRAVLSELGRVAGALATELGHPVSGGVVEEVSQSMQAAMADAAASDAVRTGRLLRTLAASGFDPVDLTDAVAAPGGLITHSPRASAAKDPAERERAQADAALQKVMTDADRVVDAAEAALDDIDSRIGLVDRRRDDLELDLARAEATVRDLRADIASVDREGRALARDRDKAVRTAEAANEAAARLRD